MLAGTPVTADVRALDDCDLLALDRAAFLAVAEEQPSVLQRTPANVRNLVDVDKVSLKATANGKALRVKP